MQILTLSPARLRGQAQVPPAKSTVHRALISAALGRKPCLLTGFSLPLCDDIQATLNGIAAFGAAAQMEGDAIRVFPAPPVGDGQGPVVRCRVNACAASLRMLIPVFLARGQRVRLVMEQGLARRPLDAFAPLMARLGASLTPVPAEEEGLCALELNGFMPAGHYEIDGSRSSQFASGMLLALAHGVDEQRRPAPSILTVTGPIVSRPYLDMTLNCLRLMGTEVQEESEGVFHLMPSDKPAAEQMAMPGDWSQAAVLLCVDAMGGDVALKGMVLDGSDGQGDARVADVLGRMGLQLQTQNGLLRALRPAEGLTATEIDCRNIPDLAPILALTCTQARGQSVLRGVSRLRIKECDRLEATCQLLGQLGAEAHIQDEGDTLIVHGPAHFRGGFQADAWGDHRMAMFLAAAALISNTPISLTGWESVSKSWPGFWDTYRALGGMAE